MGCERYNGCIICVLFQISWQLQTQNVKNRILSDSLLGNKLYLKINMTDLDKQSGSILGLVKYFNKENE